MINQDMWNAIIHTFLHIRERNRSYEEVHGAGCSKEVAQAENVHGT